MSTFPEPGAVLAYLSRYTHRVAISNSRLIRFNEAGVTFRYKDYRRGGAERQQTMTLAADEFIRRFLLHVLPKGFHRIRHYGLLAGTTRKAHLEHARRLLGAVPPVSADAITEPDDIRPPCPCCGGRMLIIETFERWRQPRAPPPGTLPTGTPTSWPRMARPHHAAPILRFRQWSSSRRRSRRPTQRPSRGSMPADIDVKNHL